MGLEADYPAVRINDPTSTVAVWNGAHRIIGTLGPDDHYHSAAANVTCTLHRWNGVWYKLLNASAWDPSSPSAYVSAARTHVMPGGPAGYVLGPCQNNTDQPGRSWVVIITAVLASLAVLLAAVRLRRRRPVPPAPPRDELPGLE